MMRSLLLFLAATLAITASAQSSVINAKSTEIQIKIRQVELMNLLLPLVMKRDQVKALLPAVEAARKAETELLKKEERILRDLEADLDKAISAGAEKGEVPSPTTLNRVRLAFSGMAMARQILSSEHLKKVADVLDKVLDEGQKKAASNALPKAAYGKLDPKTMSERDRMLFFVSTVILDPYGYSVLLKIYAGKALI